MIKYALRCDRGHEFEAWFAGIAAYEQLARAGHVTCAVCGRTEVERAIMAPAVARRDRGGLPAAPAAGESATFAPEIAAAAADASPPSLHELRARLKKLRDAALAKSEYVGPRFADEARVIHEEAAEGEPPRSIHGEATPDEVRGLLEDGIPVAPIPRLPEDAN